MTDKVQKIREEVEIEKLHGNPYYMIAVKDILEILDMQKEPDKWEPQTGDTFRKKGTTSPTYHLCDKREDGITFGFVENREVGIAGGEITIFALQQDYELVERPKSIEDVVKEELNKVLQTKVGQKTKDESTNEDLGDYINELSKQFPEVSFGKLSRIAVRVSKWQQNQDVKNKLPKVTDRTELDEYAYQCAYDISNDWLREKPTWKDVEDACKLGAKWKASQGVTEEAVIGITPKEYFISISQSNVDALDLCAGDKVIVQLIKRKD